MIASLAAVSNALGLASSAAWLGAQFPQLWTNYKLQSAEGLALPFLANWLAGALVFSPLLAVLGSLWPDSRRYDQPDRVYPHQPAPIPGLPHSCCRIAIVHDLRSLDLSRRLLCLGRFLPPHPVSLL
ncbi:hypothetical protein FRC08_003259 [Ceratobasidium sp. 394]|nr:hypothetical protein FRC08_003259 [Ceratobasidium sp. 394]